MLDAGIAGRRVIVGFGAANQVADVWWNGVSVGHHAGGYTRFGCDVTEAARPGANVLAVRVDNRIGPIPPLIADYDFYGGLYRDAWLAVTEPVDFDVVTGGAWAECRAVSERRATVVVHARLANSTDAAVRVELRAAVRAPDGRAVLAATAQADVPARDTLDVALPAQALEHPQLWSPDAPHLYEAAVELLRDGRQVRTVRCPLGVRWFAVDSQNGFLLNGRPLRLNGTNRHQDRAGYGSAVPESLQRDDMRRIKADGFNFVRLAHYPQSEAVLEECDRLGLVVWEEIPVVNQIDTSAAFAGNVRAMLREMIEQHRAHPSVAFWGLANEVLLL
jgi:beta-galactosidase